MGYCCHIASDALGTRYENNTERYVHSTSPLFSLSSCPNQKSNVTDFSATRKYLD